MTKIGFFMSDAHFPTAEILAGADYDFVLLDVEHGAFSPADLDRFIPFLNALGLEVFAKVLEPSQTAIQQALDFGARGVVVPHVRSARHAAELAGFAKYPPAGVRSMSGGRPFGYGPWTDEHMAEINRTTLFLPLVEDPGAVDEVEEIAALKNVDGFMMGPGDLSLLSGRGQLRGTEEDVADRTRCVDAMIAAGKSWIYPAWTETELEWAIARNAPYVYVGGQHQSMREGVISIRRRAEQVLAPRLTAPAG